MKNPLVSVIIPVYNGASCLKRAVISVQKSSFKNFEIILVNDGSTDQSKSICLQLQKENQNIRTYSFKKNKGLSRTLNFAINKASGKYIARLNQDDLMLPTRLKKQTDFLEKNPDYVMVGGALELFNEKGKNFEKLFLPLKDKAIRKNWLYLNSFADPAVMYVKEAVLKTGGYKQKYYPADDFHLWYRIGNLGKLANLNQVVTRMKIHRKAATMRLFRQLIKKTWQVHLWSARNIKKPSLFIFLYWVIQHFVGMVLPPKVNFFFYRLVKKTIFLKSQLKRSRG